MAGRSPLAAAEPGRGRRDLAGADPRSCRRHPPRTRFRARRAHLPDRGLGVGRPRYLGRNRPDNQTVPRALGRSRACRTPRAYEFVDRLADAQSVPVNAIGLLLLAQSPSPTVVRPPPADPIQAIGAIVAIVLALVAGILGYRII